MTPDDDFSSNRDDNNQHHQQLDVSDVVNLCGLDDLVKNEIDLKSSTNSDNNEKSVHKVDTNKSDFKTSINKRKRPFLDDEDMDFQQWTNGFLTDSIDQSNDDIDVDYYATETTTPSDQRSNKKRLSQHQQDDFVSSTILNELNYSRSHNGNDEDEQNLAVQAVNQAVSQAVAAVQEEVANSINNDDSVAVDIAAAVAAAEEAVMNGLLPSSSSNASHKTHDNEENINANNDEDDDTNNNDSKDGKRSDRQFYELIQNAINNDKMVKQFTDKSMNQLKIKQLINHNHNNERDFKISGNKKINRTKSKAYPPSEEEDLKLREAIDIASELIPKAIRESPSRSFSKEEKHAIDDFVHKYQSIENIAHDEFLDRIWSNDRKRDRFWENLQRVLPHRTRPSLYKHVRRTYHVFAKRGIWTPEEDNQLQRLTTSYGGKWKFIGEQMKRMPEDCRDRWRNYIKCGQERNTNKWSIEEEQLLKQIVDNMEGTINWTKVSELMEGKRSRIQCRYKWNKIMKRNSKERVQQMDTETKIRLLELVRDHGNDNEIEINWDHLAHELSGDWSGLDVAQCFELVARQIGNTGSGSGGASGGDNMSKCRVAEMALASYSLT